MGRGARQPSASDSSSAEDRFAAALGPKRGRELPPASNAAPEALADIFGEHQNHVGFWVSPQRKDSIDRHVECGCRPGETLATADLEQLAAGWSEVTRRAESS